LKGPLSEEEVSDDVDGDHDSVILDPERLEPRMDEEDTYVVTDLESFNWGGGLGNGCVYHITVIISVGT
jgi:NIMA (never in mitosis gene a)-related kinase